MFASDYPSFEVLVVDNASTDGSQDVIDDFVTLGLHVLKNKINVGFAEANNRGATVARGRYVVLLNSDTIVIGNWLNDLVEVMETNLSVGAVQGKILRAHGSVLDSAGDIVDISGFAVSRGNGVVDYGQFDSLREIFSARGAAMLVRRDLFLRLGGFDPSFFMVMEDVDLCWRLRLAGYKIQYVPSSVIVHEGSASIGKLSPDTLSFHSHKNRINMVLKNYATSSLFAPVLMILLETLMTLTPLASSIVYPSFATRKHLGAKGRAMACLFVLTNLRHTWRNRLRIQRTIRRVSDKEIRKYMIPRSITLSYFPVWFLAKRHLIGFNQYICATVSRKHATG